MRPRPRTALDLIGDTPLVELLDVVPRQRVHVYAKLEWHNPGGSVKDRPAKQMIFDAIAQGRLRPGQTIIDATSGNTGTALAFIGAVLGFPVTLVIPEVTSARKQEDMERFGATVMRVPGETTEGALDAVYRMVDEHPGQLCHVDQYTNPSNTKAHYLTTGPEILAQCPEVTHLVAAQGSFGTLGGAGRRIKEVRPDARVCAVVARPGTRSLFGMKEAGRNMPLVDDSLLDARILVSGYQAHQGIRAGLAYGFQLGPSAGGVLAAAVRLAERLDEGHVVCVFADGGAKYPGCPLYDAGAQARLSEDQADDAAFTRW